MKRILVIILCFICVTPIVADESVDSLEVVFHRMDSAYLSGDLRMACDCFSDILDIYKKIYGDVSQDTTYANLIQNYGMRRLESGDYNIAIEALTESMQIRKRLYGQDNADIYYLSIGILMAHYLLGAYDEVVAIGSTIIDGAEKELGIADPNYVMFLPILSRCYGNLGHYSEAIRLGEKALEIIKNSKGTNDTDYIVTLKNLVGYYEKLDDIDSAIRYCKELLEIQGKDHSDFLPTLNKLETLYSKSENYYEAIQFEIEASKLTKEIKGPHNSDYALSLTYLASYYSLVGNYQKAIEAGTEAMIEMKNAQECESFEYAVILNNLAEYYSHMDDFDEAVRLCLEALEVLRKTQNADSLCYGITLSSLSGYYSNIDRHHEGVRVGYQALRIIKDSLGDNSSEYVICLSNIASNIFHLGKYKEALLLFSVAMDIAKGLQSTKDPIYATVLDNLAFSYYDFGNYNDAMELFYEAMEIRKEILPSNHTALAVSLSHLAQCHGELGNYNEAIQLETNALEIIGNSQGQNNLSYARSLNNLAIYYDHLEDYDKAVQFGNEALRITKNAPSKLPSEYAHLLSNLASYYSNLGNDYKAIQFASEALEIVENSNGIDPSYYATILGDLAKYFYLLGYYEKSIQLGNASLAIIKETRGTNHPLYATSVFNLANIYHDSGDTENAFVLFKEYLPLIRNNVQNMFSWLTSNERHMYWGKYCNVLNQWLPATISYSRMPETATILYDNTALFAKGLLLSTELEMTRLIQESDDSEALQMFTSLRENRQILNTQYSKPIAQRHINCDSLERISTELERQLMSRIKVFGDFSRNIGITWRDVQNRLNDDDIAIEFLSYANQDKSTHYIALSLCKNDTAPELTHLFTLFNLDQYSYTASSIQEISQASLTDRIVWGPLSARLEGKKHVYFSPSGTLHNINIEYYPSMEGKECHRLSSTRELVTSTPNPSVNKAMLIGDIDYNATPASILSHVSNSEKGLDLAVYSGIEPYRGNFDYHTMLNDIDSIMGPLDPLPGTRAELNSVASVLDIPCDELTGAYASEESFKALSGQRKNILHISTHGFYYNAEEANNTSDDIRMMLVGDDRPSHYEDPLLRCGLCLAGANRTLSGRNKTSVDQDDGILNALEIAQIDLRGLDLVVLSACQTALGDIAQGEGVFGLQRGFKKAGAQSILMSLWDVDLEVTRLLMTEFYKCWASGMTKTSALKNAQDVVRQKYPDPHDWAAFILLDALD